MGAWGPVERALAPGEVRFVPRSHATGPRTVVWEVYDRATGSCPGYRFDAPVAQDHDTQALAQAECNRLEAMR